MKQVHVHIGTGADPAILDLIAHHAAMHPEGQITVVTDLPTTPLPPTLEDMVNYHRFALNKGWADEQELLLKNRKDAVPVMFPKHHNKKKKGYQR
jgi:hypothetical protein